MSFKYLSHNLSFGTGDESFYKSFSFGDADSQGGQIIASLGIDKSKISEEIAESIFDTFRSTFYADVDRDLYDRFETSLREINRVLNNLKEREGNQALGLLNVALGAIRYDELHISQCGDAEIYLLRKEKLSAISEGLSGKKEDEIFLNIASGEIEGDDTIIFSSTRLLRNITKNRLTSLVRDFSPTEVLDEIQESVSLEGENKGSVVLLSVEGEEGEEEENSGIKSLKDLKGIKSNIIKNFRKLLRNFEPIKRKISKNNIVILIFVGILILFSSVFLIQKNNLSREELQVLEEKIKQISNDLNRIGTKVKVSDGSDRGALSQELVVIEDDVKKIIEKGYSQIQTSEFLEKISEYKDDLDNVFRISNDQLKLEADLSGKRSDVSARGFFLLEDKTLIYDENAVYESFVDGVKDPRTIDPDESMQAGTYFDNKDVIVFFTEKRKLIEYKDGQSDFIDTEDLSWHNAVDVESFNRNIYLLNPENNEVWKYERGSTKYSKAKDYNLDADVKDAVDMTINGYIWILKSNGEIVKLLSAKDQHFELKNLPTETLTSPTKIFTPYSSEFTNNDSRDLFILEPSKKRVLQFEKEEGKFVMQYVFDGLEEEIVDIKTSLDQKKLYLLTKTKLYSVEI